MNKESLLKQCAELGIKCKSRITKTELLELLKEVQPKEETIHLLTNQETTSQEIKKGCKQCGELGHGIASTMCKINILKKESTKQKVKDYFLSQDGSDDSSHFEIVCDQLGISLNQCKEMYSEIPWLDLLKRKNSVSSIVEQLTFTRCDQCHKNKCTIQSETLRTWKEKSICDKCFTDTFAEREKMWELVSNYKPIQCLFCNTKKENKEERFHFDHLNMFDKEDSICTMIMKGVPIEKIYQEMDKCQVLCFSCHQIITHMERAMGFTKQKKVLTRKLNLNEITKEDHEIQMQNYQKIYDEIMIPIYKTIKEKHL